MMDKSGLGIKRNETATYLLRRSNDFEPTQVKIIVGPSPASKDSSMVLDLLRLELSHLTSLDACRYSFLIGLKAAPPFFGSREGGSQKAIRLTVGMKHLRYPATLSLNYHMYSRAADMSEHRPNALGEPRLSI